jgi:hypothetical protein
MTARLHALLFVQSNHLKGRERRMEREKDGKSEGLKRVKD